MRADLHMHSHCSDGVLSPSELVCRAKQAGVELMSLTDHDNLAGNSEAAAAARAAGLHFVRGIEVSAYIGATKVHVLGYGCREGKVYENFLAARVEGGRLRAADSIGKANAFFGLSLTMDDIEAYHVRKKTPLHSMHVERAFASALHREVGEVYREAFAPFKPAFSDLCRPAPLDALAYIHGMGGLAVLAHPVQILVLPKEVSENFHLYTETQREEAKVRYAGARNALMEQLTAAGLDGIECYHPTHTEAETEEFLGFARAHGLFVTGGSDFHADDGDRRVGLPRFYAGDETRERLLSLEGSV